MSDNKDVSSDEEVNGDEAPRPWIPYGQREKWRDVVPVEQDDGPNPIVAIAYSDKFRETHNYFRAILKSQEKSERALNLTADCIWLNAANYTVWQYRREILKELGIDLKDELKFTEVMTRCNFKNYQVWHHRKIIVEWMQDPSAELDFTSTILEKDAKNYHAWQHRQWVIATFKLFDGELEYVEQLIAEDVRNNSAWNQRYFVLSNTTQFEPEIINHEVDYTLRKISEVPGNESAWNYLRGIQFLCTIKMEEFNKKVLDKCKELYDNGHRSNHLLSCIGYSVWNYVIKLRNYYVIIFSRVDICQERHSSNEPPESLFHINRAFELYADLAQKYDKIRKGYWEYLSLINKNEHGAIENTDDMELEKVRTYCTDERDHLIPELIIAVQADEPPEIVNDQNQLDEPINEEQNENDNEQVNEPNGIAQPEELNIPNDNNVPAPEEPDNIEAIENEDNRLDFVRSLNFFKLWEQSGPMHLIIQNEGLQEIDNSTYSCFSR